MFTKQQTFNTVYRGLAAQGFCQSSDRKNGTCLYRGPEGMKCAAGHIIPDSLYTKDMEHGVVNPLYREKDYSESTMIVSKVVDDLGHDLQLVRDLQTAHDLALEPEEMKAELIRTAEKHNLIVPTI